VVVLFDGQDAVVVVALAALRLLGAGRTPASTTPPTVLSMQATNEFFSATGCLPKGNTQQHNHAGGDLVFEATYVRYTYGMVCINEPPPSRDCVSTDTVCSCHRQELL